MPAAYGQTAALLRTRGIAFFLSNAQRHPMSRTIRNLLFWLIIAVLLCLNFLAFSLGIVQPDLNTIEFTNLDLVRILNQIPFVTRQSPDVIEHYCVLSPKWLGLLIFWPLFLIPTRHSLTDFPRWQRAFSVFIRIAILVCIVLALIDIEKIDETSRTSIIYAVDVSPSVTDEMLSSAHQIVADAIAQKNPELDVQVVTFSDTPHLVTLDENGALPPFERDTIAHTDMEAALRFCYALFPENAVRRIVLLGDGNQTKGDVLAEAARARAQDIRIDVTHLPATPAREIMIKSIDVRERDNLRVGKPFEILLDIASTHDASVHLDVDKNGLDENALSRQIDLVRGDNEIALIVEPDAPGTMTMQFTLDGVTPQDDRFAENNKLLDQFEIQGKPKILYIEENSTNASYLQRALAGYGNAQGQSFDVEVRSATGLPESMRDLLKYSAVILGDVPRETSTGRINVTGSAMTLLQEYVKKQGGGFIALGGENAFGPGGYTNTPVEQILPVSFKNENHRNKNSAAMALIIDKSGSMRDQNNLEIAKEAAKGSVASLQPQDRIMIIGFDDTPYLVVPMTRAVNRYSINAKIAKMTPQGGTNIRDALEMAYLEMAMVSASTKHVILLTDGHSSYAGIDSLVREMAKARITVSTIALANADTSLLSRIANLGKGRAYIARDSSAVPRLFLEETQRVTDRSIVETPFVPAIAKSHEMIQGVALQTLLGYVQTKAKNGSQTILKAPDGAPILAHWNIGTGKTTAFTSDAKNRWASPWIKQSSSFAKFWAQVVRATMKTHEETQFEMRVTRENERVRIIVDAISERDTFLNGLSIVAEITRPNGEKISLDLPQTAPGFYENVFDLSVYGTYQASAELLDDGASIGFAKKTFSFPYALEFANPEPNVDRIDAIAQSTGGFINPKFEVTADPGGTKIRTFSPLFDRFLWLALAGLLVDVLLRRVRFARR